MIVAGIATFLVVTVSALAAYPLSRMRFRGREAIFTFFTFGLLFPIAVAALPLYLLLRQLGLLESLLGVALPEAAFAIPLTIIILRPFMRAVPGELEDAAAMDGCSRFGFFLARPGPALAARADDRDDPLGRSSAGTTSSCRCSWSPTRSTGRFRSASRPYSTRAQHGHRGHPRVHDALDGAGAARSSSSPSGASSAASPAPSRADAAGVEFANPVLPGMHPDPSVCRVGGDYYLACSSFEYFPGVPLYASRDLVTWRPIGHALTRRSQLDLTGVPSSGGIYAPTLRHHDGTFFVVTTLVGRGNFVVTARDPRGPWSDPTWLDVDGIDPSLAFLDERIYYTRNGQGADPDHPFVYQGELTRETDGFRIARTPRVIWKGTGGVWPEAPHLYRRGGWYYLVTAEGGTSYGHSVVVARSRAPDGPFEPSPHGPLLTHRGRPRHPIQATGHADLVDLEDGTTWAVFLGIRPTGGRHHHLGRETYLAPVHWRPDGWPRMPPIELTMQGPPLPRSDAADPGGRLVFRRRRLPLGWRFVRNPVRGACSLRAEPGFLRLWGGAATLDDVASPSLVCRPQQHLEMTARARCTGSRRSRPAVSRCGHNCSMPRGRSTCSRSCGD